MVLRRFLATDKANATIILHVLAVAAIGPCMPDILVVDHEPAIRSIIQECLEAAINASVTCVGSGSEGAELLSQQRYDLAIVDALVSGVSGFRLAAMAAENDIPTILLSGHPKVQEQFAAFEWPHIIKPFSVGLLEESAVAVIRRSRSNIAQVKASSKKMGTTLDGLKSAMAESHKLMGDVAKTMSRLQAVSFNITDSQNSRATAIFLINLEGEEAGRVGEPASANPYEDGTQNCLQWLAGWKKTARNKSGNGD